MQILDVRHRTTYRYRHAVTLGPHRLMLRPRASHDLRLIATSLTCTPPAAITWAYDVFGNSVATATFSEPAAALTIESRIKLELYADAWPIFPIAPAAQGYPFDYSADDRTDLGAMTAPRYPDPGGCVGAWARSFVCGDKTDTLSLLKDLNAGILGWIAYRSRDDEGTQPPFETLACGAGACRDIALLMVEAARHLGFGARIVSGYLYTPPDSGQWDVAAGTTHAWVEIFLPGAGWIAFDPTNRKVGGANLIPVAVARDIAQAIPIAGSFSGTADDLVEMKIEVKVESGARE